MGLLFRSDNYLIGRKMVSSTLVPIFVKIGRWSAKLLSIMCTKLHKNLIFIKKFYSNQCLQTNRCWQINFIIACEDPTFIYPTINTIFISAQKEIVKQGQWPIWLFNHQKVSCKCFFKCSLTDKLVESEKKLRIQKIKRKRSAHS